MEAMMKISMFLLPLTLCLAHHALADPTTAPAGQPQNPLIDKACEKTAHKELCVQTLSSVPESHNGTLNDLAFIALRQASSNASHISAYINMKLKESHIEVRTQQGLDQCLEHYLDAADQLEDSIAAFTAKGYNDVRTWVQAAVADSETCDKEFTDEHVSNPIMSHENRMFRMLCNNALSIVRQLA